ncbi:MAG: PilZ domain-containing protein [Rhizobiales bacterium]|nr:PilZ domain-containing protein [Hyphomicrobiales bacterium]MBI3672306.1 PilZ domain-containing protein [Hyphomicrobiales bacterium]
MAQDSLQENNRIGRRQRVLKQGKILLLKSLSVVDCAVRDLSDTGARLQCGDQSAIPHEFHLVTPADGKMRDARVIWRRGGELGVAFSGAVRKAPPLKW